MGDSRRWLYIGTSGYSYKEWKDVFYPKSIKLDEMLQYYCTKFDTVEINSSFYKIPSAKTVEDWNKTTPQQFKFCAKIPNLVTHKCMLDPEELKPHFELYLQNMMPLITSNKLTAILLQLPPKFSYEEHLPRLESFLAYWNEKKDVLRESRMNSKSEEPELVVEFRNTDWMREESFNLLRKYDASYCTVVEPLLPPTIELTSKLYYMRFHGFGQKIWFDYLFSNAQLDEWKPKIQDLKGKVEKVIMYFNNHFSGNAVKNADYMKKILEYGTPIKPGGLNRFL